MVSQLALQTISILMTGISMTIAAAYYTLTLRNTQKNQQLQLETRQTQLYMQVLNKVSSQEFQQIAKEVANIKTEDEEDCEKLVDPSQPYVDKLGTMMRWWDGLGYLVKNGFLDVERLSVMGAGIAHIRMWQRWEPFIKYFRETRNNPDYQLGFEYVAKEMTELRKRRGLPSEWKEEGAFGRYV